MGFSKSNTITGTSGQAPEFLCENGAEINQVRAERAPRTQAESLKLKFEGFSVQSSRKLIKMLFMNFIESYSDWFPTHFPHAVTLNPANLKFRTASWLENFPIS